MTYPLTPGEALVGGLVTSLLVAVAWYVGKWIWRITRPQAQQQGQQPRTATAGAPGFPWKRTIWIGIIAILCICFLPEIKNAIWFGMRAMAAGIDGATRDTPRSAWGVTLGSSAPQPVVTRRARTENKDRYQFFVDSTRKLGWKVLPTEVDFDIPLDGTPRYLGMNVAFLGGSELKIDCPGYWSGKRVKLFAKADEETFTHLGHDNSFPLIESGSVTGGGAIIVKGEKDSGYEATSNRIHVEVAPLPGHHRIATTKVCDAGTGYDWGTVQIGTREEAPPWQLYIRFADEKGITLTPSVIQQKPGEILFGVMEDKQLKEVFSEIVSKATNVYEPFNVPRQAEDPMLRIKTPNITEGKVVVEVILDIDNTR